MGKYFSLTYDGPPFVMFSVSHIAAVGVVILACIVLALKLRRAYSTPGEREFLRHALAAFAVLNLVVWYAWEWSVGLSTFSYSLPLQICTFATVLCPLMLWQRSYRVFEVVYFWGFAGATQALLTPDLGPFGFPHFVFITFFTSHGVIWASLVYMLVAEGFRPHWSSLGRVFLITLGFLACAGLANWLTGGNYMYVARKPPFPTLLDYLGPWPWYIGSLIVIALVLFVVVYLPFAIRDRLMGTPEQTSPST